MLNSSEIGAWFVAKQQHLKRGQLTFEHLQHEHWCGLFQPHKTSTCTPARVLIDDQGQVLAKSGKVCETTLESFLTSIKEA
jgi:hypothetical protein